MTEFLHKILVKCVGGVPFDSHSDIWECPPWERAETRDGLEKGASVGGRQIFLDPFHFLSF